MFGAVIASGLLVAIYAALQFYEVDPFEIYLLGGRVVSSLGNPIFVGAFLLMVTPMTLALALRSSGSIPAPVWTMLGIACLTVLMLGMVYTQSRGPWVGLAAALFVFLLLVWMSAGWRASLRGLLMSAAAIGISAAIVTAIPSQSEGAQLSPRALSVGTAVASTLSAEFPNREDPSSILAQIPGSKTSANVPSSMQTRLLLWKGSVRLAVSRPWFQPQDRPFLPSLHLFGYGPNFLQFVFPLIHPKELSHLTIGPVYFGVQEAHNNILNRWVEMGLFGLAGYLVLLGSVAVGGFFTILSGRATLNQRLATAAVIAAVAGRSVEQLVGIPHLTDEALFWTLLGVIVAAPVLATESSQTESIPTSVQAVHAPWSTSSIVSSPLLSVALALVFASVVTGFTLVKNANYAFAESRATSASNSLAKGDPDVAMRSIDGAIALAPDVSRYHVIRANILDRARSSRADATEQAKLPVAAYLANGHAVVANPFDIYGRLHFAEAALTLGTMGHPGKSEEAVEEYRQVTTLVPQLWLSHFLLGRAYVETGQPGLAVEAYREAINLDPRYEVIYDRRAEAYGMLGEHSLVVDNYEKAIELSPGDPSRYVRRGVALFALSRLEEAIQDFDEAIELYESIITSMMFQQRKPGEATKITPSLAMAYNNRGSAYHEAGQIERAIDDYTEAIRLAPKLGEAFYNRATAFAVLGQIAEARSDLQQAEALGITIPN